MGDLFEAALEGADFTNSGNKRCTADAITYLVETIGMCAYV